jgi:TolB-like protein/Tfp pilus assembly protein PilF
VSLYQEFKRRNVFRVAVAYLALAWLLTEVSGTLLPGFGVPDWGFRFVVIVLVLGFVPVLIFTWAFEITADGVKREKDIVRDSSTEQRTARRLDFLTIGLIVVALAFIAVDRLWLGTKPEATPPTASGQAAEKIPAAVTGAELRSNSIAVLPFANRSARDEDTFFVDGIHDDLLTQLAKIDDLKVISRTSVMEYRDTSKKIAEIAGELGVATIMEGGIQRAGDRIRINAQLIDVSTDEHLWAETFDREMSVENIFEIQSEIARQIVNAVRGELSLEEVATLQQLPTRSLEAYEAYMHAKAATFESAYSAEKFVRAEEWARKAVRLDPNFTWAWSILVEIHGNAIWMGFDASEERVKALESALEKTMADDPESAEAQFAYGEYLYRFRGDYVAALGAYKKAAEIQPGNARYRFLVATAQRRIGEFDESIASFEKALQIDPANRNHISDYLLTLMYNAEYEKAFLLAQEAIERFPHEDALKSHLAFIHVNWKGDVGGARALLDEMEPAGTFEYVTLAARLSLYDRDLSRAHSLWDSPKVVEFSAYGGNPEAWRGRQLGEAHMLLGNRDVAAKILEEFIAGESTRGYVTIRNQAFQLINLALAHALLGEPSKALKLREDAVAKIGTIADGLAGAAVAGLGARVLALAGRRDLALNEIERSIDTPGSRLTRWDLTLDPRWDFFRDDEHFNDLIRPLNNP